MKPRLRQLTGLSILLLATIFLSEPAAAFRCGSKIVKDGMHEAQVLAICGDPTTRRDLGYAVRSYDLRFRRHLGGGWTEYRSGDYGYISQEVVITEFLYNFGPRKLMRRLLFEGGVLVTIESLGYGYLE